MTITDLKLAIYNLSALLLSFTGLKEGLQILLLLVSITYTGIKIYNEQKNNNNGKPKT